jgi:hypothetical protein
MIENIPTDLMAANECGEKHKHSRCGGWPTKVFTCICIGLTFLFSMIDTGPLVPPFPSALKSIDCHSVKIVLFTDQRGFLDFCFLGEQGEGHNDPQVAHSIASQQRPHCAKAQSASV